MLPGRIGRLARALGSLWRKNRGLDDEALVAYFGRVRAGAYVERFDAEVHLLDLDDALQLTREFGFHPIVRQFDGLVLDDARTGNHHVLLRHGPLAGQVFHLAHDGEGRVVFPSALHLLAAADRALENGTRLSAAHPAGAPAAPDQAGLAGVMARAMAAGQEGDIVLPLIPSLDLRDLGLLQRLVHTNDFLIVEAVANEIARRPAPELRDIACQCCVHPHAHAARAGRAALRALAKASLPREENLREHGGLTERLRPAGTGTGS